MLIEERMPTESHAHPGLPESLRDPAAAARLFELVYDELKGIASRQLLGERAGHTLQATAVVHEAFLRLADHDRTEWKSKAHFLAVAATTLRRVLVDHARARKSKKRGGDGQRVTWEYDLAGEAAPAVDLIDLNEALERLALEAERPARVVELRYFGGLTTEEVAALLDVSSDTIKRDWRMARAWLNRELDRNDE